MNKISTIFTMVLVLMTTTIYAQDPLKEYKAGHSFNVSLPDYMSKTGGIIDNIKESVQEK